MVVLSTALVALSIAYAFVLIRLTNAFRRLTSTSLPPRAEPWPQVSVIIAARNEAEQIEDCVRSVLANTYPQEFEVIVVDDDSEDETASIVSRLVQTEPRVRLLAGANRARTGAGKRRAIKDGIDVSKGRIVLLTDADCVVPSTWIHTTVARFDDKTRFVSGPVTYPSQASWLGRVLELELFGLVTVGGGSIALGRPNMCNGANIAFRKDAFREVGGYAGTDGVTSGDDELLMQKIAAAYPGSVSFCADSAALVETEAPETMASLYQQRKRWASKAFHYKDIVVTTLAVVVYTFNVVLLAAIGMAIFGAPVLSPLAAAVLLKIGSETWLFWTACRHFGRPYLLPWLIPGQLFVIPYVVLVGAAGTLGGYRWKGRDIQR